MADGRPAVIVDMGIRIDMDALSRLTPAQIQAVCDGLAKVTIATAEFRGLGLTADDCARALEGAA